MKTKDSAEHILRDYKKLIDRLSQCVDAFTDQVEKLNALNSRNRIERIETMSNEEKLAIELEITKLEKAVFYEQMAERSDMAWIDATNKRIRLLKEKIGEE